MRSTTSLTTRLAVPPPELLQQARARRLQPPLEIPAAKRQADRAGAAETAKVEAAEGRVVVGIVARAEAVAMAVVADALQAQMASVMTAASSGNSFRTRLLNPSR